MTEGPRYGDFGRRLVATLLDALFFGILSYLLLSVLYGPGYFARSAVESDLFAYVNLAEWLINWLLVPLVTIACWMRLRGTPGKLLLGLQVVDARSGAAVGPLQALLRYLGYFVSALPLGLGFLWIFWDRRRQGFHDKLAKTAVVYEDESRRSLAELEKELS